MATFSTHGSSSAYCAVCAYPLPQCRCARPGHQASYHYFTGASSGALPHAGGGAPHSELKLKDDEVLVTPDLTRPILGFRRFNVQAGTLISTNANVAWFRGENRAVCTSTHTDHPAPQEHCTCGLYAYYLDSPEFEEVLRGVPTYEGYRRVLGFVVGWGTVVLHPNGFRSEFARIVGFQTPILGQNIESKHELEILKHNYRGIAMHESVKVLRKKVGKHGIPVDLSLRPKRTTPAPEQTTTALTQQFSKFSVGGTVATSSTQPVTISLTTKPAAATMKPEPKPPSLYRTIINWFKM